MKGQSQMRDITEISERGASFINRLFGEQFNARLSLDEMDSLRAVIYRMCDHARVELEQEERHKEQSA